MSRTILIPAFLAVFSLIGCQEIPDDSVSSVEGDLVAPPNGELSGLTYFNEDWGFVVRRPSGAWGLSAQTSFLGSGASPVQVRIYRRAAAGFRPEMFLQPQVLPEDTTLDGFATLLEGDLQLLFSGYAETREKQVVEIPSGPTIQWRFSVSNGRPSDFPGDEFLAAVHIHRRDGYFMLGSGESGGDFPVGEYRSIIESLQFTK